MAAHQHLLRLLLQFRLLPLGRQEHVETVNAAMECAPILTSAAASGAGVEHLLIIARTSLRRLLLLLLLLEEAALVEMAMLEMGGVRMENVAVNGVGAEQAQPTATSDSEKARKLRYK